MATVARIAGSFLRRVSSTGMCSTRLLSCVPVDDVLCGLSPDQIQVCSSVESCFFLVWMPSLVIESQVLLTFAVARDGQKLL